MAERGKGAPCRGGTTDQAPGLCVPRTLSLSPFPPVRVPETVTCPQKRLNGVWRVLLESSVIAHSDVSAQFLGGVAQLERGVKLS